MPPLSARPERPPNSVSGAHLHPQRLKPPGLSETQGVPRRAAHQVATGMQPWGIRPLSRTLAWWVQGALWVTAGLYALVVFAWIALWSAFETYWSAPAGRDARELTVWVNAEGSAIAALQLAIMVWFVAFILLIVWWNQAYKSVMSYNLGELRWSSGLAVGVWFIPVANLLLPKFILNEIERVSLHVRDGGSSGQSWRQQPLSALGIVFWVALVGGVITNMVAGAAYPADSADFDPDALRVAYGLVVAGACAVVVANVTGALFIRRISKRLAEARIITQSR
jgi:hypothetical protein